MGSLIARPVAAHLTHPQVFIGAASTSSRSERSSESMNTSTTHVKTELLDSSRAESSSKLPTSGETVDGAREHERRPSMLVFPCRMCEGGDVAFATLDELRGHVNATEGHRQVLYALNHFAFKMCYVTLSASMVCHVGCVYGSRRLLCFCIRPRGTRCGMCRPRWTVSAWESSWCWTPCAYAFGSHREYHTVQVHAVFRPVDLFFVTSIFLIAARDILKCLCV